jgi:NADP-dependent aldehyde dehydrogenase
MQPVLINGKWREAAASGSFQAYNPTTKDPLPDDYPVSSWADCDVALNAAMEAAKHLRRLPGAQVAVFLEAFADEIELRKESLVAMAHAETALPVAPRLADVELPRTVSQLRQAAQAARDGSWTRPIIDTKNNIRSCFMPLGPVCVFGPNNFPFAFGSLSGGDFAAAVAAGNPVIGKANSSHPGTTRLFGEAVHAAMQATKMHPATVQLIYRTSHADGERLVSDPRAGATAYTGSRPAGLRLKAVADAAGRPIYLELSSVNPVVILPGALEERGAAIAEEFKSSGLMGAGQFCTNPGLVILLKGAATNRFLALLIEKYHAAPVGTLLSASVEKALAQSVEILQAAGATALVGGTARSGGTGYCFANTLLQVSAAQFLADPETMQTEAFGNAALVVVADDIEQATAAIEHLEGNLTGCIYSHTGGADDAECERIMVALSPKVGRVLNDKMPTGVAVSAAMNHGGPFPATGHPGFTAVGIPTSIHRFAMLQCYDNVRPHRLPAVLHDKVPNDTIWRSIDGNWVQG